MPAVIKALFTCPRCEASVAAIESTFTCPECGLPLGKQELQPYTVPYTLSEQHLKYIHPEKLIEVLAEMPIEKANNILNDALIVLENLSGKRTHVSDIRILVELAKRIGAIATAYEHFLEVGGKHHPTHYIKQQHQEDQENQNERQRSAVEPDAPKDSQPVVGRTIPEMSGMRTQLR